MLTMEHRERLRRTFISIAVLHELQEHGGRISIFDEPILTLIRPYLDELRERGLVARVDDNFVPTAAAAPALKSIAALYARLAALNIFENVAINFAPESLPFDGTDQNIIHPACHDLRFPMSAEELENLRANGFQFEDFRVWMIEFINLETGAVDGFSPHVVFFLNTLRNPATVKNERFWLDLRCDHQLNEIDRRIDAAYRWQSTWGPADEGVRQARYWYEAGMREMTKRNGRHCGACNASLALMDLELAAQGQTLEFCPNPDCRVSFAEPPAPQFQCPRCQHVMSGRQRHCPSCSVRFDHRLSAGAIEERVTTIDLPVAPMAYQPPQYEVVVVEEPVSYWTYGPPPPLAVVWGPVALIF